jgi:hypothetical protein
MIKTEYIPLLRVFLPSRMTHSPTPIIQKQ